MIVYHEYASIKVGISSGSGWTMFKYEGNAEPIGEPYPSYDSPHPFNSPDIMQLFRFSLLEDKLTVMDRPGGTTYTRNNTKEIRICLDTKCFALHTSIREQKPATFFRPAVKAAWWEVVQDKTVLYADWHKPAEIQLHPRLNSSVKGWQEYWTTGYECWVKDSSGILHRCTGFDETKVYSYYGYPVIVPSGIVHIPVPEFVGAYCDCCGCPAHPLITSKSKIEALAAVKKYSVQLQEFVKSLENS